MNAMHENMTPASADQWAEHLTNYRTYQTEETFRTGYSVMLSKLSPHADYVRPGYVVAEVHYLPNGEKLYFVRGGATKKFKNIKDGAAFVFAPSKDGFFHDRQQYIKTSARKYKDAAGRAFTVGSINAEVQA